MVSAKMVSRCVLLMTSTILLGLATLYVIYVKQPPPHETLKNNKARRALESTNSHLEKDVNDMTPAEYSRARWDAWVEVNDLVPIGELYNKCDGDDRLTVGRMIMTQNKKTGGLMSRTFANITFENDITTGDIGLQVWYNGKELYKNHWELCTVEEDNPETKRVIFCPIKAGKHKYIKDSLIPSYLPKGRYTTKSWAYDQNDKMIGCAFTDFTL